jgi:uncharacterized protein (DUF1697 family)
MITYISMLRGINVSGQKKIPMEALKKLYESLGFKNVRTYIQSGNVVFECPDKNVPAPINMIKKKIRQTYGFEAVVFIRTKDEFKKLIDNTPFLKKDLSKLHVTFLSETPARLPMEEINKGKAAAEDFYISNREIYLYCPDGYGGSTLSNNFFERKLKVSATTRNWRTVNELFKLAGQ